MQALDFNHGIGRVSLGKYVGDEEEAFINLKGEIVAEKNLPKSRRLSTGDFHEGLASYWDGKKFGFSDEQGNVIISARFVRTARQTGFYEGLSAVASQYEKWGFIDKSGKFVIPDKYREARQFHDGLAAVCTPKNDYGYTWAFIDHLGKQVGPVFVDVKDFQDGFAIVSLAGRAYKQSGVMSVKGRVTALDAWECDEYAEGLMGFFKDGLVGFMDKNGKVVIQPRFAGVGKFSEGLAPVILNDDPKSVKKDLWSYVGYSREKDRFVGYVDRTGKLVIPAHFRVDDCSIPFISDEKSSFKNGLAVVRAADGKFGVIDKTGRWQIQPMFVELNQFFDGLAAARIAK